MDEPFLDFTWPVFEAYTWCDLPGKNSKPQVVPAKGVASLESPSAVHLAWEKFEQHGRGRGPILRRAREFRPVHTYHPMDKEHATLFHTFAAVEYWNRDAISAFASAYGLLGVPSPHYRGESHLTWAREICLMREAIELGQQHTPASTERDHDIWGRTDALIRASRRQRGQADEDPAAHRRDERTQRLNVLVNAQAKYTHGHFTADQDGPPRYTFMPSTLLSAMWLQLSLDLTGVKKFPQCKRCYERFEVSADVFRSHREFCSDVCKTLDYRRRKQTAWQLKAQGLSLADIATGSDTKVATVRRWVQAWKASAL